MVTNRSGQDTICHSTIICKQMVIRLMIFTAAVEFSRLKVEMVFLF